MNPHIVMLKQQLPAQQLLVFESEMQRYRKEAVLAFLLAFFLGIFGVHHFYLGRNRAGIIMLVCTLSVVGLIISFPWKIINWFTVWGETAEVNDEIEYALLYSMYYGNYANVPADGPQSQQPPPPPPRAPIGGLPMRTT